MIDLSDIRDRVTKCHATYDDGHGHTLAGDDLRDLLAEVERLRDENATLREVASAEYQRGRAEQAAATKTSDYSWKPRSEAAEAIVQSFMACDWDAIKTRCQQILDEYPPGDVPTRLAEDVEEVIEAAEKARAANG